MEITGILVKKVGEREGVSQRNGLPWKTAEFLVEVPGQYPRHTNFSVSDGQVGRISRFESLIGKTVTVSFDIDAHEYQGRWFNDITAWGIIEYVDTTTRQANIEAAQAAQKPAADATGTVAGQQQAVPPFPEPQPTTEGKNDDLPF